MLLLPQFQKTKISFVSAYATSAESLALFFGTSCAGLSGPGWLNTRI